VEASASANAALKARLEELLGEYDRVRKNLTNAQARMKTMTGTAETTDHTVSVTVDFRGQLTDLRIEPRAYTRYSPSLLAERIMQLTKEATAKVTSEMGELMGPFLPKDLSYSDLMSGQTDLSAVSFGKPVTNENFDEWRARFSGRPSMDVEPPKEPR
jgi:DNA-binding protein YbaB